MSTNEHEIIEKFKTADTSDFQDFYALKQILDWALWVLWVAKDKLEIPTLTAKQISLVMTRVKEVSADELSIKRAFAKAGTRVYDTKEANELYYEIMKAGKDYLVSQIRESSVTVFHFEPGKRYTSKNIVSRDILTGLKGDLQIVDPYVGERTLDIIKDVKQDKVQFLTRLANLEASRQNRFLRELKDLKSENPKLEFRDYPNADVHDRYIIARSNLVLLGHSLKDLGSKDSFAIVLSPAIAKNMLEDLSASFNRRWKQSKIL